MAMEWSYASGAEVIRILMAEPAYLREYRGVAETMSLLASGKLHDVPLQTGARLMRARHDDKDRCDPEVYQWIVDGYAGDGSDVRYYEDKFIITDKDHY